MARAHRRKLKSVSDVHGEAAAGRFFVAVLRMASCSRGPRKSVKALLLAGLLLNPALAGLGCQRVLGGLVAGKDFLRAHENGSGFVG